MKLVLIELVGLFVYFDYFDLYFVKMYFDFFFNVKEALQWINRLLALRGRIQGEGAGCFEFSNYATVLIQYVFLCDLKILRDV